MLARTLPWLALTCATVLAQVRVERAENLPDFPDPAGRAGMAAAAVRLPDGSEGLLVAGGANFPGRAPWDGGEKAFYADIVLLRKVDGAWKWEKVGDLPEPVAYAAFGPCKEGMIVAGGVNASGHLAAVRVITPDGKVTSRRPLPITLAYPASAVGDNQLYVIGGQATPTSTTAEPFFGVLDLEDPAPHWEVRPWVGNGRILASAGVLDGKLLLAGGCTLRADAQGKPQRTYLSDTRVFKLGSGAKDWESASVAGPSLPFPAVASCGPVVVGDEQLMLLGADDGSHYGKSPQTHPGQRADILVVDLEAGDVKTAGTLAVACVTAPAIKLGTDIVVVSGETKPGIRTAAMQVVRLTQQPSSGWGLQAWLALAAGVLAAAAALWTWQARRRRAAARQQGA